MLGQYLLYHKFLNILKKFTKFCLVDFLNKYLIIDKAQYGFRTNMFIGDVLANIMETIHDNLENLKKCSVVSIDLKKSLWN